MVYPNIECYYLCQWMLTVFVPRLTGSQITLTNTILAAAAANTSVSETEWKNFSRIAQWRNPYYIVYRDYSASTSQNLATGLLSYFKLDGNNTDSLSNLTMSEANITYSTGNGKINQGAGFNGSSSYIKSTGNLSISTSYTISINLWVKYTSSSTLILLETSPNYNTNKGIIIASISGQITAGMSNGAGAYNLRAASGTQNTGSWIMVTLVCNRADPNNYNQVLLYINGSFSGTLSYTSLQSGTFSDQPLNIGARNASSDWYNGALDEIGVWSRILSQADINTLYNSGAGLQYPF